MITSLKVIVVSDISLGYGTPQILRLANSIADTFSAEVLIIEPDQPERPKPIENLGHPGVRIERIYTATHPYSASGLIEYILSCENIVKKFKPHIFVGASHAGVRTAALCDLSKSVNILYCLENAGDMRFDNCTIPFAANKWDIVLFPEKNRAKKYYIDLQLKRPTDTAIVYNANTHKSILNPKQRNGRIFYGGLISQKLTLAKYFEQAKELPVDFYGNIEHFSSKEEFIKKFNVLNGASYKGYVRADDNFFITLAQYAFSIVGWMPVRFDFLNAAPNKFFDSVACGVPPICAPHPQCVELIKKWQCGLLMEDWSYASFRKTTEQAIKIFGTDYYDTMVQNCQNAVKAELSWPKQFENILPHIEKKLRLKSVPFQS